MRLLRTYLELTYLPQKATAAPNRADLIVIAVEKIIKRWAHKVKVQNTPSPTRSRHVQPQVLGLWREELLEGVSQRCLGSKLGHGGVISQTNFPPGGTSQPHVC